MTAKRKRRASPARGLAPGESLKRDKLAGNNYTSWGWVGTEVLDASNITREHIQATCGFSRRNKFPFCMNLYRPAPLESPPHQENQRATSVDKDSENDLIIVSDDDPPPPPCSKKQCKSNPNCLNYLGQEIWEDEGNCFNSCFNIFPRDESNERKRESSFLASLETWRKSDS